MQTYSCPHSEIPKADRLLLREQIKDKNSQVVQTLLEPELKTVQIKLRKYLAAQKQ